MGGLFHPLVAVELSLVDHQPAHSSIRPLSTIIMDQPEPVENFPLPQALEPVLTASFIPELCPGIDLKVPPQGNLEMTTSSGLDE